MKDFPWGYVVGAAVTVIGLLFNQWRADRREVDRWNKETDRDHVKWQREQAERLEQWKREDLARAEQWKREDRRRWIEEQRALYAASLKKARAYLEQLQTLGFRRAHGHIDAKEVEEMIAKAETVVADADEEFSAAVGDVQLIASDPVMRTLTVMRVTLQDAEWAVMYPAFASVTEMQAKLQSAQEAYAAYFRAVRQDLGISESQSSTSAPRSLDVSDKGRSNIA